LLQSKADTETATLSSSVTASKVLLLYANIRCACSLKATLTGFRKRLAGCDSSVVSSAGVEYPVMTTAVADSADWLGSGTCPDGPAIASVCVLLSLSGTQSLTIGASS